MNRYAVNRACTVFLQSLVEAKEIENHEVFNILSDMASKMGYSLKAYQLKTGPVFFLEKDSLGNSAVEGVVMTDTQSEPKKSRRLTVTGDIGEFRTGQVLKDNEQIASYYRMVVSEGADVACKLTDEQILEVIDSVPGDDEDAEVERVEKMAALGKA